MEIVFLIGAVAIAVYVLMKLVSPKKKKVRDILAEPVTYGGGHAAVSRRVRGVATAAPSRAPRPRPKIASKKTTSSVSRSPRPRIDDDDDYFRSSSLSDSWSSSSSSYSDSSSSSSSSSSCDGGGGGGGCD